MLVFVFVLLLAGELSWCALPTLSFYSLRAAPSFLIMM
jgi:hypothetical protein